MIIGDDAQEINELKLYLQKKFQTKYLGQLQYLFGIEVARSKKDISLNKNVSRSWYIRV